MNSESHQLSWLKIDRWFDIVKEWSLFHPVGRHDVLLREAGRRKC
jgi:hypothetical protein